MKASAAVVDTNVVVSGLLTADAAAPTARILDAMLRGAFPFLLSRALLREYRAVLLRRRVRLRHRLSEVEVDAMLTEIVTHAIVREPQVRSGAPDAKDEHVWSLVQSQPAAVLVTGDHALAKRPPAGISVMAPREFAEQIARIA